MRGSGCVRATQNATGLEVVHAPDPVEVARGWARQGARWLHVIDLARAHLAFKLTD